MEGATVDASLLKRELTPVEQQALGDVCRVYPPDVHVTLGPNFSIDPATGLMMGYRVRMPVGTPVRRDLFNGPYGATTAAYMLEPAAAPAVGAELPRALPAGEFDVSPGLHCINARGRFNMQGAPMLGPHGSAAICERRVHNPDTFEVAKTPVAVVSSSQPLAAVQAAALLAHAERANMTIGELLHATVPPEGMRAAGASLLSGGEISQRANEQIAATLAAREGLKPVVRPIVDTLSESGTALRLVPVAAHTSRVFVLNGDHVEYDAEMVKPRAGVPHLAVGHPTRGVYVIGARADDHPLGVTGVARETPLPTGAPLRAHPHAIHPDNLVRDADASVSWPGRAAEGGTLTHALADAHMGTPDDVHKFIAGVVKEHAPVGAHMERLFPVKVHVADAPQVVLPFRGDGIGPREVMVAARPPRYAWA